MERSFYDEVADESGGRQLPANRVRSHRVRETSIWGLSSFYLPLSDLGGGAVNTKPLIGIGAPTFVRATAAWTKLASGLWTQVSSGVARSLYYGWNTSPQGYAGYLPEPLSVNRLLHARDLTNAAWVKNANADVEKVGIGIDGVANSCTELTSVGVATCFQSVTLASAARTFSAFIKKTPGLTGQVGLTLDGGTSSTLINASDLSSTIFTRYSRTQTLANPNVGFTVGDAGQITVDMCQLEDGVIATSPAPTVGATVQRDADILTYPAAGVADGAIVGAYCEFFRPEGQLQFVPVEVNDGTSNERLGFYRTSGVNIMRLYDVTTVGGVNPDLDVGVDPAVLSFSKIAGRYKLDDYAVSLNGSGVAVDTTATRSVGLTTISIGRSANVGDGTNYALCCGVRNVRFWNNYILPNELLKVISR